VSRLFRSCWRVSWSAPAIAVIAGLLLASTARAQQSDFSLQFSSRTPGTATAMHLYIVYRNPADPSGKPSPIKHLVITSPQGTRIDLAMPRCTASDSQIMAEGPSACPTTSQVGQGTLTAITGFGPPIDPYLTDVTIFNTGQGVVEILRDHNTGATLTDDRIQIQGNVFIGNPPAFPGGPPDGQTAVRTIDFTFPATSGYITTPRGCRTGRWTSSAAFTFADGSTQHVSSATPCKKRHRRLRVTITKRPKSETARHRATFRFHANRTDGVYLKCRRDTRRWKRCSSPKRYRGLEHGRHHFRVWAVKANGKASEPARWSWRVMRRG
jgi:hypothetical protein